jgi:DNA-binding FadR family transcriptional regulator
VCGRGGDARLAPGPAKMEALSREGASTVVNHHTTSLSAPPSVDAIEAVFRPVRVGNAFEECVERLLSAIKLGLVGEGERLPAERELAGRLDVSRMTLREAIRSLQAAGFVESRRGRLGGTFVVWQPTGGPNGPVMRPSLASGAEAGDTLVLREVLEVGAAVAAASRPISLDQRAHLLECLAESAEADLVGYRRSDSRLHLAIAEATGSTSLVAAVADVRMRVNDLLDEIPLLERNLRHSNDQHRTIVDAVLEADPVAARVAMEDHLAGTAALLRGFLG